MAQVYAVVHDGTGNFLMARKNTYGFFFSTNGGAIVQKGQGLNGAGLPAFPGGGLESYTAIEGAKKEFLEETRVNLNQFGLKCAEFKYNSRRGKHLFSAVFFQVDTTYLRTIQKLAAKNLIIGNDVASAIYRNKATSYKDNIENNPYCPLDNELFSIEIWNVDTNKDDINALCDHEQVGWYYLIIKELEKRFVVIG